MSRLYRIGEFADKLGVTTQTLRNWEKEGKLKPAKVTDGGTRYYSEYQYNHYVGNTVEKKRITIGYCRVSSHGQKDDLERQIDNVKTYMYAKGYQFEIVTDIGSGINYKKKGLQYIINKVLNGEVDKIVVLYKDRLIRFGYELIEYICEKNGTCVEIIDNTEKTEQEELVEDLVQIITVFSCKLQGKRVRKTKEIIQSLKEGDNNESDG